MADRVAAGLEVVGVNVIEDYVVYTQFGCFDGLDGIQFVFQGWKMIENMENQVVAGGLMDGI